jgi:ABC-type nickel/cobalt efflux system permease component RcnA
MDIKWSSLGEVAVVSLAVGVAIVVIFAVGILAWSLRERTTVGDGGAEQTAGNAPMLTVAAGLCFLACAAIIAYGIYLIVPQFH